MKNVCPVCGYDALKEPAYDEHLTPSYKICPSCYFEYGYDDEAAGITHQQWREQWIAKGMPWKSAKEKPANWNPKKQLENISIYL